MRALCRPPGLLYFQLRACLSSHSLEDALSLWTLGVNLNDPSRSASFCSGAETGTLVLELQKSGSKDNYIAESTLSTVHRILCWLAEDFVPLERVELTRPQSDFSEECHYLFYGAPVLFGHKTPYNSGRGCFNAPYRLKVDAFLLLGQ